MCSAKHSTRETRAPAESHRQADTPEGCCWATRLGTRGHLPPSHLLNPKHMPGLVSRSRLLSPPSHSP